MEEEHQLLSTMSISDKSNQEERDTHKKILISIDEKNGYIFKLLNEDLKLKNPKFFQFLVDSMCKRFEEKKFHTMYQLDYLQHLIYMTQQFQDKKSLSKIINSYMKNERKFYIVFFLPTINKQS